MAGANQLTLNVALIIVAAFLGPATCFVVPAAKKTVTTSRRRHAVAPLMQDHVQPDDPTVASSHARPRLPIDKLSHCTSHARRHHNESSLLRLSSSRDGRGGEQTGKNSESHIDSSSASTNKGIYGFDKEIVEMEQAEAPFRRVRMITYGVFALAVLALGGVSIAGLAGSEEVKELGENLPNPLIDAGVLGLSFYFWVEEVKTKRSALRLLQKRREEELRVPNRSDRRVSRSKNRKQCKQLVVGRLPSSANIDSKTANATATRRQSSRAGESSAGDGEEEKKSKSMEENNNEGGMFDGIRKTLEAVNQQSYYQALALNQELEDKGVLPKLQSVPEPPGKKGGTEPTIVSTAGTDMPRATEEEDSGGREGVASEEASVVQGTGIENRQLVSEARGGGKQRRVKAGKKGKGKK